MRVKPPIQELNRMSLPGLKPGPLDPASGHPPPVNPTMIAPNKSPNISEQVVANFHDSLEECRKALDLGKQNELKSICR